MERRRVSVPNGQGKQPKLNGWQGQGWQQLCTCHEELRRAGTASSSPGRHGKGICSASTGEMMEPKSALSAKWVQFCCAEFPAGAGRGALNPLPWPGKTPATSGHSPRIPESQGSQQLGLGSLGPGEGEGRGAAAPRAAASLERAQLGGALSPRPATSRGGRALLSHTHTHPSPSPQCSPGRLLAKGLLSRPCLPGQNQER